MAILFMESCGDRLGTVDTAASFDGRGFDITGAPTWSTAGAKVAGETSGAIKLNTTSSVQITSDYQWTAVNELIINFFSAYNGTADTTPTTEPAVFLRLRDGGDTQLTLTAASQGSGEIQLDIRRGTEQGTIIGTTTTGVIDGNVYHHYEVKIKIDNTTGSVVIRRDGSEIFSLTGVDTQDNANSDVTNVAFGSMGCVSGAFVSGMTIFSLAGAVPNFFIGRAKVVMLQCTADTAQDDWLPITGSSDNFTYIDDFLISSSTASIKSTSSGDKSRFVLRDLPTEASEKEVVAIGYYASGGVPSGTETINYRMHNDTTDTLVLADTTSNGFRDTKIYFADNPDTSAPWTQLEIDAIEVEVELV